MIKRFLTQSFLGKLLTSLVVGLLAVFVLVQTIAFRNTLVQDMFFTVGIVMFSLGLLTASGATKMFSGMGYVLKKLFTKKVEGLTYYEYLLTKKDRGSQIIGYPMFFAGLTFIVISLAFADILEKLI